MTEIKVKIKTANSPEIRTITIKSDCKVEDIMKEIEKFSSIPPSDQRLIFKYKILNPEKPISNYKIENDATLILVKTSKPQESNSNSNSKSSQPSTTNNASSNHQDKITVKIRTNLDDTIHNVSINKSATVLILKQEIEKVTHIPASQQRLIIQEKTMKNSEPLSTYNISNDSNITVIKIEREQKTNPNPTRMRRFNLSLEQICALLNDPIFIEFFMNSPECHNFFNSNPQLREVLQNPETRRIFLRRVAR